MDKQAKLKTFADGSKTITERPTAGCFDKDGKFIGTPEAGKEILLDDAPEAEAAPAAAAGSMHPATAE